MAHSTFTTLLNSTLSVLDSAQVALSGPKKDESKGDLIVKEFSTMFNQILLFPHPALPLWYETMIKEINIAVGNYFNCSLEKKKSYVCVVKEMYLMSGDWKDVENDDVSELLKVKEYLKKYCGWVDQPAPVPVVPLSLRTVNKYLIYVFIESFETHVMDFYEFEKFKEVCLGALRFVFDLTREQSYTWIILRTFLDKIVARPEKHYIDLISNNLYEAFTNDYAFGKRDDYTPKEVSELVELMIR
jgi:hypothetical protein